MEMRGGDKDEGMAAEVKLGSYQTDWIAEDGCEMKLWRKGRDGNWGWDDM